MIGKHWQWLYFNWKHTVSTNSGSLIVWYVAMFGPIGAYLAHLKNIEPGTQSVCSFDGPVLY